MSTRQADAKTNRVDTIKQLETLFLDDQLVTAIERGADKGDTRAIQMGYQRLGLMRNGEFLVGNASTAGCKRPILRGKS
jgi:hypothetical protein